MVFGIRVLVAFDFSVSSFSYRNAVLFWMQQFKYSTIPKMTKPVEIESSIEKDTSPWRKAQKQKEIIAKIRNSLKRAAAKNKARLCKKTSSVARRLQKSSLIKSHPSFEASLYERTLLFNNRKLARSLQNLRHENRLLQDQIVELNHQKLDVEVNQADLNCQLFQEKQKNVHKDKLITKLRCKLMEIVELLNFDCRVVAYENQHSPVSNEASIKKLSFSESSYIEKPSRVLADASQPATVSNSKDDLLGVQNRRRPLRLSNPFDLSAIMETPDKSLNDSVCQSYPDSIRAPGILDMFCETDSAKFRRETFVVHASKQISDLPSPLKNYRSRIRIRRSDSFEPMLRLSESPEKSAKMNNIESTIRIPVDMELTSVLHTPITGFDPGCNVLLRAARQVDESKVILSNTNSPLAKGIDSNFQIKDNDNVETSSAIFNGNATFLLDDNNRGITDYENTAHMKGHNKDFKFVTERLSNKGDKLSAASTRTSPEFSGIYVQNQSPCEPKEQPNISSNLLDGVALPAEISQENDAAGIIPEQVIAQQNINSSNKTATFQVCTSILQKLADSLPRKDAMEAIDAGDQLEGEIMDEKCEVALVLDMPPGGLDKNLVAFSAADITENSELSCKKKRVSFVDPQSQPPVCHSKQVKPKPKRKRSAASKSSAFRNDEDGFPLMQSSTKLAGSPVFSRRSGSIAENQIVPDHFTLTRKHKKLSLKRQTRSSSEIEIFEETVHYPDIPKRSVLGEVSPNRLKLKPKANFSPNHGKPTLKIFQSIPESEKQELQNDNKPIEGRHRRRAQVVYKEISINRKMRRE